MSAILFACATSMFSTVNEVYETLESKFNKNLYILGEMLDVDGICGGFNLHFAFASAYVASQDIINKVGK